MALLPCTATVTQTAQPDGSVLLSLTIIDAGGASRLAGERTFPPATSAMTMLGWIRDQSRTAMGFLLAADLPASFTVQIGLDTTMRELDLL